MTSSLPLALTQGDACGIGPEIIAKLFRGPHAAGCFVIGDAAVQRRAVAATGGGLVVAAIGQVADLPQVPAGCVPVLAPPGLPPTIGSIEMSCWIEHPVPLEWTRLMPWITPLS